MFIRPTASLSVVLLPAVFALTACAGDAETPRRFVPAETSPDGRVPTGPAATPPGAPTAPAETPTAMPGAPDGAPEAPPLLRRIGPKTIEAGQLLTVTLSARSASERPLSFGMRGALPMGATFDAMGGRFTWTPTAAQVGGPYIVEFYVSDGVLETSESVDITVVGSGQAVDLPPVVAPLGDFVAPVGQPFELFIEAHDPNGDPLAYDIDPLPPGGQFDAASGVLRWVPTPDLAGETLTVTFTVSDGVSAITETTRISVSGGAANPGAGPVNQPPVILAGGSTTVTVGEMAVLQPQVRDEAPDELRFALEANAPRGATIDARSGQFTWSPAEEHAGRVWPIAFIVRDASLSATGRFEVRVEARPGGDPVGPQPQPVDPGPADPDPADPDPVQPDPAQPACGDGACGFDEDCAVCAADCACGPVDPAIEVDWTRTDALTFELSAWVSAPVAEVRYTVNGQLVGTTTGYDHRIAVRFPGEAFELPVVVDAYDSFGNVVATGVALVDASLGAGVFIRQVAVATYEIGIENAPADAASIEVAADGFALTDSVTGEARTGRMAVRSEFNQLGPRTFEIDSYNVDGSWRGTLRRNFTLR